jgi:hypothetical protein
MSISDPTASAMPSKTAAPLTSFASVSTEQLYADEASLNFNLDKDSITGRPYTPGSATIGGLILGTTPFGYALRQAGSEPVPVTFSGGNASPTNPGAGWTAIAATRRTPGFDLYWRNTPTSQFAQWTLNPSGLLSSYSLLTPAQLIAAESGIGFVLNGNGFLGAGILG